MIESRQSDRSSLPNWRASLPEQGPALPHQKGEASDPFASLYAEHYRRLVRVAYLLAGPADAEDLAQEVFLRALKWWNPSTSDRTFWPWLQTTIIHLHLSAGRRLRREVAARRRLGPHPESSDAASEVDVVRALEVLSPRERAAVVLRYFEDLPEQQVADRLGCRIGTAKALLHRGRMKLRIKLEGPGGRDQT